MQLIKTATTWSALAALALSLCLAAPARASADDAAKPAEGYVCPPCGCAEDETVHKEKGSCSSCGMSLIKKAKYMKEAARLDARPETRPKAAILVFEGVQIIDYTGPYEVFGQASYEVYTVAADTEVLRTAMGMNVKPHYAFKDAPHPDVLIIPGGGVGSALNDEAAMAWIAETAPKTKHTLTVCNGAFILAKTGLLDGKSATTYYGLIDSLRDQAPKVKVVSDQRFVDNGQFITTAGLSSGIDGSLYVISKLNGLSVAQSVALNMEYDWKEDSKYARADFADRLLKPRILSRRYYPMMPAPDTKWRTTSVRGDANRWEVAWQVRTAATPASIQAMFRDKLESDGGWRLVAEVGGGAAAQWRFADEDGSPWRGEVRVAADEAKDMRRVTLSIERADRERQAKN